MFSKNTVKQLRIIAKALKMKGFYKLKKKELIKKIKQMQKMQKQLKEEEILDINIEDEEEEDTGTSAFEFINEAKLIEELKNDVCDESCFDTIDDEDWGEDNDGEDWGDTELTDVIIKKSLTTGTKATVILEIITCQKKKCGETYFNTIICPKCGEINMDIFNKNLRNIKYNEAKKLLENLRTIMEESLKRIFEIEINMFMSPIKMSKDEKDICHCCFIPFDKECRRVDLKCHRNFCEECVKQWIKIKVRDNEVKPYIMCLSEKCHHPLPYDVLNKYMDEESKEKFIKYFSYKTLIKYKFFKQCKTYNCYEGVLFNPNTSTEHNSKIHHCKKCNEEHKYEFKSNLISEEFKELIKKNIIRLCPSCSAPSTKDRKSCNVIFCTNCSVYWNWETKKTGATYESVYSGDKDHWSKDVKDEKAKDNYFEDSNLHGEKERVNENFR